MRRNYGQNLSLGPAMWTKNAILPVCTLYSTVQYVWDLLRYTRRAWFNLRKAFAGKWHLRTYQHTTSSRSMVNWLQGQFYTVITFMNGILATLAQYWNASGSDFQLKEIFCGAVYSGERCSPYYLHQGVATLVLIERKYEPIFLF
jgi:hypothetical protein